MARGDDELDLEEAAAFHHALAHPARVAILRALRRAGALTVADLRREVSTQHADADTRTIQYHVGRMHAAGLVDWSRRGGHDTVRLVRDLVFRLRVAPP